MGNSSEWPTAAIVSYASTTPGASSLVTQHEAAQLPDHRSRLFLEEEPVKRFRHQAPRVYLLR